MPASLVAITHAPSPLMEQCERTYVERSPIDLARAQQQHRAYRQMLRDCGAEVRVLEVNRDWPDCVFVEDTAIVLDELAVLARMGTESRRGETAGVEAELRKYREVRRIEAPATLEGGDALRVGRTLLVGVSRRTNRAGVEALAAIAKRFGYELRPVPVRGCLHLKTACTALPDETLLVNPAWLNLEEVRGFETLTVAPSEPWAANVALIGSTVFMHSEHPATAEAIRCRGFDVRMADISEFAKAEGGVTCLSLLFSLRS